MLCSAEEHKHPQRHLNLQVIPATDLQVWLWGGKRREKKTKQNPEE